MPPVFGPETSSVRSSGSMDEIEGHDAERPARRAADAGRDDREPSRGAAERRARRSSNSIGEPGPRVQRVERGQHVERTASIGSW